MDFSRKKLPGRSLGQLYSASITSIQPYALMLGPTYVLLKENEKYVAVKGPLDFFIETEIQHLLPYGFFYFPKTIFQALPFRTIGQKIRAVLMWEKRMSAYPDISFSPSPFEVSNIILNLIGPLWWKIPNRGPGIESFFVTILVNELCSLLPKERLLEIREKQIDRLDHALFLSGWVVFLALHLGYFDYFFLNQLRYEVFEFAIQGKPSGTVFGHLGTLNVPKTSSSELSAGGTIFSRSLNKREFRGDLEELTQVMEQVLIENPDGIISQSSFIDRKETVFLKLNSRLKRIKKDFLRTGSSRPTIYGSRGFIIDEP